MRICDLIEELVLDNAVLTNDQIGHVIDCFDDAKWNQIIEIYLRGIGNCHMTPGKVVYTYQGLLDFYRETHMFTRNQKFYVVANLLRYWNQMSCESRADLLL